MLEKWFKGEESTRAMCPAWGYIGSKGAGISENAPAV